MDPLIEIGELAPRFTLDNLRGNQVRLQDYEGVITVLNFWSAECTWSERVDHELLHHLQGWKDAVKVIWIASNASEDLELIRHTAADRGLPVVLVDSDHRVADLFGAQTTPHLFVLDETGMLRYQGAWDDITFRHRVATQVYVPKAIEALLQNQQPEITQTPPYGCVLVRYAG